MGATDGVGDDENAGIGAVLGGGLGELADNRCVGVEKVVTGHAWLSWDTGGDEDNLGSLERSGYIGLLVSSDLHCVSIVSRRFDSHHVLRTVLLVLMWAISAATPGDC